VISDEEAADIRKKLEEGWRGPVLLTWPYRFRRPPRCNIAGS
jgi:hypothetical protein